MITTEPAFRTAISRRRALSGAALLAGGVAMAGASLLTSSASAKVAQKGVAYQPTPKGAARCDNCTLWQPPAACKLVEGPISPAGWCNLYAKK